MNTPSQHHHKLSLAHSLLGDDDTFSKDLLRQFDKKRSKLHFELGFTSQEPSPDSSTIAPAAPVAVVNSRLGKPQEQDYVKSIPPQSVVSSPPPLSPQPSSSQQSKRSSRSDLLYRIKSRFHLLKRNNKTESVQKQDTSKSRNSSLIMEEQELSEPPTKLVTKATISTDKPSNQLPAPPMFPPSADIQYPPKPLVYSPIEPILEEDDQPTKTLLHRISMPLMKVYHHNNESNPTSLSRNKSVASFMISDRRRSEPNGYTRRKTKKGK